MTRRLSALIPAAEKRYLITAAQIPCWTGTPPGSVRSVANRTSAVFGPSGEIERTSAVTTADRGRVASGLAGLLACIAAMYWLRASPVDHSATFL